MRIHRRTVSAVTPRSRAYSAVVLIAIILGFVFVIIMTIYHTTSDYAILL